MSVKCTICKTPVFPQFDLIRPRPRYSDLDVKPILVKEAVLVLNNPIGFDIPRYASW